ncbi:hypothetical protein BC628DRAFT_1394368 [Trametes gibbosa]|nr:hypothetical protein BC628DRAFT_1394368 [Trametes gibbosa]
MKRAAEKQLVKDDIDQEEVEEDVGTGFTRADESALAHRPIRGLPKRSLGSAAARPPPSSAATETLPPPGKFGGFGGFGTNATTSSSSFSFTAPSTTSNSLKPAGGATSSSPFSFSEATTTQPSSLFGTSVSSSASPATKAFASIVSSSSAPTLMTSAASTNDTSRADEKDKDVEYYKAVRGLNVSLLSALSKAIEADPFVNVADLLERYKAHRVSVDSSRDDKSAPSSSASTSAVVPVGLPSKPVESTVTPSPAPSFTMPAPPSGFSGFKALGASVTSSTSSSGSGFVPKIDTGSSSTLGSPFSFTSFKPAQAESTTKAEAPKSAFAFGPASSSAASATNSATPAAFTFGAPSPGPSLFSKPSVSSSISPPSLFGAPAPSSSSFSFFGKTTFGKAADESKDKESDTAGDKDPIEPSTSTSSSTSNFFASSAASGPTNLFAASTPDKPSSATAFSFGSASPSKGPFFGSGFPKAGSIGNPVGFGFGSPPKTPEAESASGPVKALPFTFGAQKPAAESSGSSEKDTEGGEKEGVSSGDGTPVPDAPQGLPASTSVHDQEGEGEENEVTTHEIRSKVYKMTKDGGGKSQWGDLGVGILRLKKDKDSDSRRMLLRNSSTGKITINFILYSGLTASVSDKTVSFIGHDDGQPTPYRIRCKTAAQANELKTALDREIEFVKEKSGAS